jgi:predicted exporter
MVIFLIIVLRSLREVALSIVPLVTGVLVGIAVVIAAFGSMYGITLAFGATLLGVAIDYPLHFFAHRDAKAAPEQTIRLIRTTLWLGVATTAIGYFAMLFSGIGGLAELALFAIVGLTAAAATTCWVLPSLAGNWHERRLGQPSKQWRLPRRHARAFIVYGIAGAAVVYLIATSNPIWQTDPAKLSPLPAAQLHLDRVLRHAFRAPDFNRLVAVTAASEEGTLDKLERLRPVLNGLKRRGALAGYSLLTDVFPSRAAQRRRQAAIPPAAEMRRRLQRARAGLAFKKGLFAPFLADLERSRKLPLLDRARIQESAMALRVDAELKRADGHWQAIVPLRQVRRPRDIETALAEHDPQGVYYIDVKHVSSEMLTNYRVKAVRLFLIGSALTVLLLLISLKNFARTLRVLMSAYSAALVTAAILVAAGISLTLFHLVSLLLVIGLGIDYGLFFNRGEVKPAERRRTARGVIVCNVSTVLVFGLLALAVTPVLRAIGVTVALGAVLSLVFAGLLAPSTARDHRSRTQCFRRAE